MADQAITTTPVSLSGCTAGQGLMVNIARMGEDVADTNNNATLVYALTLSVN